jgi:glycerate dehydrogenase
MKITVLDKSTLGYDTPFDAIEAIGEVVTYDNTSPHEATEHIADSEIIIVNKVRITKEIINSAKNLKLICVFATGFDNIDINAARERGIAVCNVPGYSTDSVVLVTVATALSLYCKLFEYNSFVRSGEYSASSSANKITPVFHELRGKTWGIIGCGSIGASVASVARSLGANVIVNKRTPDERYNCVDLDTLCRESDIISVHTPLNDTTRGIINSNNIRLMKKSVVLVNESRGAVFNEGDVAEAIKEGRIGALGCDVYSKEPMTSDHPYFSIKDYANVLLTPHCAWGAYESRERCMRIIADNILSFCNGGRLNRVDI